MSTTFPASALPPAQGPDVLGFVTGSRLFSPNLGGEVRVCGRTWAPGVDAEDAVRGRVLPVSVRLSSDGRAWTSEPHFGPETGEVVYVERWTPGGRAFHGFIDSVSRRVVQAG